MRELARACRGLWSRRGTSVALLLVASVCVLAAAVGPLYAGSVARGITHDSLIAAGADQTAVQARVSATSDASAAQTLARRLPAGSTTPGYPDRVTGLSFGADTYRPVAGGSAARAVVAVRTGACEHIVLTAGRCPRRTGEVVVGDRTSSPLGWHVGSVLVQQQGYGQTPLTVVGTYRPTAASDTWWAGLPIGATVATGDDLGEVEPVLAAPATLDHQWQAGPLTSGGRTLAPDVRLVPASTATCAQLRLTSGGCAAGDRQVVLSVRTAARLGLGVGSTVAVPLVPGGAPVRVAGLYVPTTTTDAFWTEPGYLSSAGDLVVVDPGTWSEAAHAVTGTVTMPLRVSAVDTADPDALRASASTLVSAAQAVAGNGQASSSVGTVVGSIDHDLSGLRSITWLVVVQLLLLAWFVLYLVVAGASEARAAELALAKLRGLRTTQTVGFGLLEPTLLVLLGLPVGYLLALPVTSVLTRRLVTPSALSVAAALVALAGGLVAVALAARRMLTRPVLEQWRRSGGDRAGSRAFSPADGIVLALALVGLVELRSGSSLRSGVSGVSLLGPALVALAIAVVGVRLLPLLCRALLGTTRGGHRVGAFVAVRQVARRPAGLRLVALLAVAVSLAWFAADASGVAAANRELRARSELGAAQVLSVQPRADLVQAVRAADPSGRWAMAAAVVPASAGQPGLLAVDSARLARVPYWLPSYGGSPAALARRLRPAGAAPTFTGAVLQSRIDITLTDRNGVPLSSVPSRAQAPSLQISYVAGSGPAVATLGPITAGRTGYSAAVPCIAGCRVTGIALRAGSAGASSSTRAEIDVSSRQLGDGSRYLPLASAPALQLQTGAGGSIVLLAPLVAGRSLGAGPRGAPRVLPVVSTTSTAGSAAAAQDQTTDLDGRPVTTTAVGTVTRLPVLGTVGQLADLSTARALVAAPQQVAGASRSQVWLAPDAPAAVLAGLRREHVTVLGTASVAARTDVLSRQGPAQGLRLFLAAAVAAAVLAAAATALSTYLTLRRRSYELATLSLLGYPRRTLLAASLGEQALLLVSGLVLGVLGGLAGSRLAVSTLPYFSDTSPLPLDLATPYARLALLVVALVVLVAAVGATSAVLLVRASRTTRLREAA